MNRHTFDIPKYDDVKFYAHIIKTTEELGFVPIGRSLAMHDNNTPKANIIFAPKESVDSGLTNEQLIPHSMQITIPFSMFNSFTFYKKTQECSTQECSTQEYSVQECETLETLKTQEVPKTCKKPEIRGNINRLIMINCTQCMICDKMSDQISMIHLSVYYGWVVCENCVQQGYVREEIITALDKHQKIPINFLFDEKFRGKWLFRINDIDYIFLKFWRRSQQSVYVSMISRNDECYTNMLNSNSDQDGSLSRDDIIGIHFVDSVLSTDPKDAKSITLSQEIIEKLISTKIIQENQSRGVSLQNLFFYNPGLYEDMIGGENILRAHISIDMSDPELHQLREIIESTNRKADMSDGKFYH